MYKNCILDATNLLNEDCVCKPFVGGKYCSVCQQGYWNLTQVNPLGCQSKYFLLKADVYFDVPNKHPGPN